MAAARQKEMKVNITVVATKTLTAGRCRFGAVVDMVVPGVPGSTSAARRARQKYISVQPLPLASLRFLARLSAVEGTSGEGAIVPGEYRSILRAGTRIYLW